MKTRRERINYKRHLPVRYQREEKYITLRNDTREKSFMTIIDSIVSNRLELLNLYENFNCAKVKYNNI